MYIMVLIRHCDDKKKISGKIEAMLAKNRMLETYRKVNLKTYYTMCLSYITASTAHQTDRA